MSINYILCIFQYILQTLLRFRYAIMILRLVYSFFFLTLVTGNKQLDDTKKTARMGSCVNKVCVCQDKLELKSGYHSSPSISTYRHTVIQGSKLLTPHIKVEKATYGYAPKVSSESGHVITSPIETNSYEVGVVSDKDSPSYQVPRPTQHANEDSSEKTICFTPRMVHRMVKAALEYVSEIPADISSIVKKLEKELNKMPDTDSFEDLYIKKPLYPLDSRTIFQMLNNKPKSETRNNLILKYELPGAQEPQCKDALEKLIEIAYNAYLELEQYPQCRDYLYKFASHQQEDRPKGHLYDEPDMKSLIGSILEQVDKKRPKPPPVLKRPEYENRAEIDITIPEIPIPQIQEVRESDSPEIQETKKPQIPEMNDPQIHKYKIPQIHEISIEQIPKMNDPQIHDYKIPQIHEYKIPQPIHEINVPQIREIHKIYEFNIPKTHEFNIPQIPDIQAHGMEIPDIEETVEEGMPMHPEETYNVLTNILKNGHNSDNGDLYDQFMAVVVDNPNNFHPKVYQTLTSLLNNQKQQNIPKLDDILLLLLDSERKNQWPWSDRIKELILSFLLPDRNGNIDPRIIDIILDINDKRPNEKHIEYIFSLLRPIKEGKLDSQVADIIIKLIKSIINSLLDPEQTEILIKLLKPSPGDYTKKLDIVDNISRWYEMGIRPNELDTLLRLLKPDFYGNTDPRLIDIIHFLLTQNKYLSPKHLNFILSFLDPENSEVDSKRIDVIHFLLNSILHPKHINKLLQVLEDNTRGVLNSKILDVLLFLNSNRLLTPELAETIIQLLIDDITRQLDDNQIKSLFIQLAPLKKINPKILVDIITLLNQDGLYDNIAEWLESTNNVGIPNRDTAPVSVHVLPSKVDNLKPIDPDHANLYRTPDIGFETEDDFLTVLKWLDNQGLLNADQGSNTDLVNNILKILDMGERELGVMELTYMLKHEKPLIYQPVYYVKYRLPILSFIAKMKNILLENPQLTADPMKLLQELIVVSNVTEVSPNLQGYPKEEILKLTVNDGDLVQAKILDEQNLNLNEQITHVHELNSDISPEELLQLNKMNEAKYYPDVLQYRGKYPDKVTMHENKVMKFPTVNYRQIQVHPIAKHQTHTFHYVERTNSKQNSLEHKNAQLRLME